MDYSNIEEIIHSKLNQLGYVSKIPIQRAPSSELGDLAIVVNRLVKEDISEVGQRLKTYFESMEEFSQVELFETPAKKKKLGILYLNFTIDEALKTKMKTSFIVKSIETISKSSFGKYDNYKDQTAIVEHTSTNPISPIHVGNLRNSIHGDTFARILEATGFRVFRHFYVNDVGLQVSFTVIGYEILKNQQLRPDLKIDLWMGQVYALMNNFYYSQSIKLEFTLKGNPYIVSIENVNEIKQQIQGSIKEIQKKIDIIQSNEKPSRDKKKQLRSLRKELQKHEEKISEGIKLYKTAQEFQKRFSTKYEKILKTLTSLDLKEKTAEYLQLFSEGEDTEVTKLFYEVTSWVLDGFVQTLAKFNVAFDQFDFESKISQSGLPDELIDKLSKSNNISQIKGKAVRYSYPPKAIQVYIKGTGMQKKDLPIKGQIPDLQLRREDGTALYAAKDIAYSVFKFEQRKADRVYNVISTEQTLPQFQLLLPLFELGYKEYSKNMKHYSYENVELRGRVMSGRLATYVTADDYYAETIVRARMAKRKSEEERNIQPPETQKKWNEEMDILTKVTLAATRFPLIETSPKKRIILDLDRELDFRRNSGPFLQYAHARANQILVRVKKEKNLKPNMEINPLLVCDDHTIEILEHLTTLQEIILKAVNQMDPSVIATWSFELALKFMKYYETYPVLKADTKDLAIARLNIIEAMKKGIATGLNLLGIPPADRL